VVLPTRLQWAARRLPGLPRVGRPPETSDEDGAEHAYLHHPYNYTWLNERAVEVPLALAELAGHDPARVLEVGNVLAHYRPVRHTVVDLYEHAPGVLNVDVVDLDLPGAYDLVLAVSAREHLGFGRDGRDPGRPARAIATLTSLLAPGGRLWCTFPVGYDPELDRQLRDGSLGFTRLTALRRRGRENRWIQVPVEQAWLSRYDWLLFTAHALVVAELVRPE
jgi:SAM-dependent methyltransferase